ncbi:MAG: hypothetical protein M1832_006009 [Thelocarpon impressellum]|nr:MAG: hypothetical protein M1832_006009 [Thelocarpon impressellum]
MATPYPPQRTHRIRRVSPATALVLVQTYLSASRTSAYLHPDALLTERGPQLAASEEGGLILHNLRRVEAGLRGETLGEPELYVEHADGGGGMDEESNGWEGAGAEGGWQDMDTYAREQEIEGDVGKGNDAMEVERVQSVALPPASKEDRKKAKKKRRLLEKQRKEESRRRDRAMDE